MFDVLILIYFKVFTFFIFNIIFIYFSFNFEICFKFLRL